MVKVWSGNGKDHGLGVDILSYPCLDRGMSSVEITPRGYYIEDEFGLEYVCECDYCLGFVVEMPEWHE